MVQSLGLDRAVVHPGWLQGPDLVCRPATHRALTAEGGAQQPIFCLPDPSPTFDQTRTSFVAWARANPQDADERAIDGLMRFAAKTYLYPPEPARTVSRKRC